MNKLSLRQLAIYVAMAMIGAVISHMQITRILIAHRPETIASTQRVLAVANGTAQPIPSRPPREAEVAG
jgi:ABC-type protease/lipase transport system fused ATPase/permease subunit